jgi:structural maintenance of chromosome 4
MEADPMEAGPAPAANAAPKERLMIKHMQMVNFKSYYGVQDVGPFHKCFSSVVGPNGSGKSNVIDAMLFVFGYRASKIRQGKLSGLIHNSENHQNVPHCSVSVHFQNIIDGEGDDYTVVPNTEVIVKREATKENTSTYTYNGKKISFKDLAVELRKLGIDLDHNRFLILQGEVEAISMMPPKGKHNDKGEQTEEGMLEYLEDIIGSNKFIEPIRTLEAKVEELNNDRTLKLGNVKIVEKEKDALEGGKTEAEGYLVQENEVTLKRNQLWQCYGNECAENLEEAQGKLQEAQASFDEANTELKAREKDIAAAEKAHAKDREEFQELKKAREDAKKKFTVFERKDVQLRENDKHAKNKAKKLEKAIATAKSTLGETEANIVAEQNNIVKYEGDLETMQKNLAVEEKKMEAIREEGLGEKAKLTAELEVKQKALEPFTAALNEAQSVYDIRKQELDLLTASTRGLAAQLDEAKKNYESAVTTETDRAKDLAELETRKAAAEGEMTAAKTEHGGIIAAEAPLVETVRSKRAKVEETRSAANNARSQGKVFEALLGLKRAGIYGRLGNLGAIDDKYDCAITTACPQLNYLVVDTVQTGQFCIDYLKKHQLGRVTAVCLDKQTHLKKYIDQEFNTPAGAERLFDLVRIKDPKFQTAFYYALRNTLVAKDLDIATKIAYAGKTAKHRVVTLEGQVIDTSGTMSGGGARGKRGGMSASLVEVASPQEIARLESSLKGDISSLETHRARKTQLEKTMTGLKKELSSFTTSTKKFNMDIASAKKAQPELKALVAELTEKQSNSVEDAGKLEELEAALKVDDAALSKAKKSFDKANEAVQKIQTAIDNVGGVRLKAAKSKADSLNKQIDGSGSSITKAKVEIKTGKAKVNKTEKKIEKDTAELEESLALREKIRAELTEMDESAMEVMKAFEMATQVLDEKQDRMQEIAKEYKALENGASKLRSGSVDLEENVKTMKAVVKENSQKMKGWNAKVKKLRIHKVGSDYFDEEDEEEEAAPMEGVEGAEATAAAPGPDASSKKAVLTTLSPEELAELDTDALEYDINILEAKLGEKKPNLKAIKEFYDKEEEYITKVEELDQITEQRDGVRAEYEDLRKQRLDCFFAGFKIISNKLKEMYQMITLGGDAELEYVDNINPFSEGIVFSVRPPRKSWKAIQNLSGGEKTLSSLALVFALHHFKPTPLYVMDEIDAALDFKNVSIVAHYIKERTKNAQFIIISLRNNMFELADRLVGIYKTDNCTKTVTINPHAIANGAQGAAAISSVNSATAKVHQDVASKAPTPLSSKN